MDKNDIVGALGGLAQATRLEVFRKLVAAEPHGLAAGEIAQALGVPHNTMSSHLAILTRAGLASSERKSRSIIYRANIATLSELLTYLIRDCCGGRPEICAPLAASINPCCAPRQVAPTDAQAAMKTHPVGKRVKP